MKFIKITMLTFALIASTVTLAQSREEICHNAAESDVAIKRSLQKDPNSFNDFLRYIDEAEKNLIMRNALREKAFWIYNRKHLSDVDVRRLSFLRCITS